MVGFKVISPDEFCKANLKEAIVLDVRSKAEHLSAHLKMKHAHVHVEELVAGDFLKRYNLNKEVPLYLLCLQNSRAQRAAQSFLKEGCSNVYVVDGGLAGCVAAGVQLEGALVTLK